MRITLRPLRGACQFPRNLQWLALGALALVGCLSASKGAQDVSSGKSSVTIEYIAHACFRITSPSGKQILIDPYASRIWLGYDFPPDISADAVLISHPHYDHDYGEAGGRRLPWPETTLILRRPGTNHIGDITVIGYAGKHADPYGKEFGQIAKSTPSG
jgi:hypothetical protein